MAVGEAEDTILEIMETGAQRLDGIRGVVYRNGGAVQVNAPRPHIEDLDRLPLPAYHAVDFKTNYQIPLINVTRGGVVNQDALIRALQDREIAGAGIDVTTPEPLPKGNPLWGMTNVILTPHMSGPSPYAKEEAARPP